MKHCPMRCSSINLSLPIHTTEWEWLRGPLLEENVILLKQESSAIQPSSQGPPSSSLENEVERHVGLTLPWQRDVLWSGKVKWELLGGPARGGGGPRSLVGILKCLVSAFCQGFTSLWEIERHTFVLVRRFSLFQLGAVATFWPMSLVGIYPGKASFRLST